MRLRRTHRKKIFNDVGTIGAMPNVLPGNGLPARASPGPSAYRKCAALVALSFGCDAGLGAGLWSPSCAVTPWITDGQEFNGWTLVLADQDASEPFRRSKLVQIAL